jgi:hypothetical protein
LRDALAARLPRPVVDRCIGARAGSNDANK